MKYCIYYKNERKKGSKLLTNAVYNKKQRKKNYEKINKFEILIHIFPLLRVINKSSFTTLYIKLVTFLTSIEYLLALKRCKKSFINWRFY